MNDNVSKFFINKSNNGIYVKKNH